MNSKTDLQRSTDLLNIPSSDFVKQAYAMAAKLNTSSPDVSAMLRASAARIDVFNALVGTVASANVERYTPDYKMHLNHELAFMSPNPNGSWISLADYLTLLIEKNDLQKQVRALAAENSSSRNAVQAFCDVVQSNTEAISEEIGADGVRVILAAMNATGNMPCTDVILREVGAKVVEGLKGHPAIGLLALGSELDKYADRIRAGEVPNV